MNEDVSSLILIIGVVGIVVYLLHARQANTPAPSSGVLGSIEDTLSGIGNFLNNYEFNAPTGDPDDDSDVVIPTM